MAETRGLLDVIRDDARAHQRCMVSWRIIRIQRESGDNTKDDGNHQSEGRDKKDDAVNRSIPHRNRTPNRA